MRLRGLRNALGMTIEEVADRLLCSPTKISRAETGMRRASLRDVRDLCQLYGVSEAEMAELMELAREAREQGWWTQYSDLKLDPYIGLEQEASAITCFVMYCLPALLQTEAYARAIIGATAPKMDPKIADQRVEVRLRRQQLLAQDNPPRYRVLLDEAVLHRRVGGSVVMAEQLGHVLRLTGEAKATVQIIPFDIGAYAASDSNFVLLEFRDSMSPVIFLEGLTNHQYLERTSDLDRYREALEHLRDSALSPRASVERIQEIREHYA